MLRSKDLPSRGRSGPTWKNVDHGPCDIFIRHGLRCRCPLLLLPHASMPRSNYDVLIVGAGIAGCALAHGLSTLPREKPLRIALVERSLSEPDRIVGELLQPGGVMALKRLGIEWCLEGIDAIPVKGYCVIEDGKAVHIPYPGAHEGRSLHHGRFIMKLREAARKAKGVELIEGSVTDLIEEHGKRVIGVNVSMKGGMEGAEESKEALFAELVIVADGCFSNFRTSIMGASAFKPVTKSHFIGTVLKDVQLPIPKHGTVALVKGSGPVLLYQISQHDTRILIDVKNPLPADLKVRVLAGFVDSRTLIQSIVTYSKKCRPATPFITPARDPNRPG